MKTMFPVFSQSWLIDLWITYIEFILLGLRTSNAEMFEIVSTRRQTIVLISHEQIWQNVSHAAFPINAKLMNVINNPLALMTWLLSLS